AKQAERRREAKIQAEIAAKKRQIRLRDRWERPPILQLRLTISLVAISVAVTLLSGYGMQLDPVGRWLTITDASNAGDDSWNVENSLHRVRSGEIWRLVTPIFLHLGVWHLVFNMYWTAVLGGMIERTQGSLRLLLLVLMIAVISNLIQYFVKDAAFGGMSGVGFGLFGYTWIRSKYEVGSPYFIPPQTAVFFLIWMIICSLGIVGGVANHAHSAGLVVGLLLGMVPVLQSRAR
ncbi:MAG: rhomboid family intramembrane serine protease, partial [Planctomycetota bacterium]